MAKKTVPVGQVLAHVNYYLARPDTSPQDRLSQCTLMEAILQITGNYRGYSHLDQPWQDSRRNYNVSPTIQDDYEKTLAEIKHLFGDI